MKPSVVLPNRTGAGDNEELQCENNLVLIGANGSGKTRLGSWIEETLQKNIDVHRISAQRALNIPEFAALMNLEQAERNLFYGREDQYAIPEYKRSSRWGSNPITHLLTDYDKLLSTLFARTANRDRQYTKEAKEKEIYVPVVDAPTDIIIRLWKDIMPQREIYFEDGKVMANKEGQDKYHGKEMSDGERVTLYLIGQCLCAHDNSIIIIDEPEVHLHKSLMARLWNKIEELCPNKLLVYITHDLDFASSRKGSLKLWIKSYNGEKSWEWNEIPSLNEIPENITIEIVGNRKNIIFSEGEKSSYDNILYQEVYPEYHIIPRGSCEKVIESTKAISETPMLHHLKAYGIIDSDYRTEEEIQKLKESGILTINVAEIENLFCIEPLLRLVAINQNLDSDKTVKDVTDFIIKCLEDEIDVQIANRAEREIQYKLKTYSKDSDTEKGLKDGLDKVIASLDTSKIYSANKAIYQQAISERSLEKILLLYNRKNLPKRIAAYFGLKEGEYINLILRLLKGDKKKEIIGAIKLFTPTIN
ncbi:MAG: DUF4435 domain-containing protein [Ignavibacteriae bacterium]|nr:MAG: DUF4435 domain-containing protein [Ignavibacteriota bacterium]